MKTLILVPIFFCIIVAFSQLGQATRTLVARSQMKMNESFTLNKTQQHSHTKVVGTCSYRVTIHTSCVSPDNTKDHISITFGDAYGNLVTAHRLDHLAIFKPCSTAKFSCDGKCINEICRIHLTREGDDGWIPDKVIIYDYKHPPISFSYKNAKPGDGYGNDYEASDCKS